MHTAVNFGKMCNFMCGNNLKKKIIFEKFSWSDGSKGPEEEYEEKR